MATVLTSHGMSSTEQPQAAASSTPKALWITVGVLAVAASALGGALLMKSTSSSTVPAAAPTQAAAPAQQSTLPKTAPADGTPEKPVQQRAQAAPQPAPARKPVQHAQAAPQAATQQSSSMGAQPAPAPARIVCASCGTVESVHAVQVKGEGTGLGVAGGAVAGGLLGNQVGGGNGKTAMTVVGAIGGALAGNEVEKRMRAATVYDVTIRMEDGSVRTVRHNEAIAAGSKVQIDNGALRMSSGTAR